MPAEESGPGSIPGRQVFLPILLTAILLTLLFGGASSSPKRYLYQRSDGVEHGSPAVSPPTGTIQVTDAWWQDPVTVCAECHTSQEAEQFRKIIAPILAAYSGGWIHLAPLPLPAPSPATATVPPTSPPSPPDTAVAGSK